MTHLRKMVLEELERRNYAQTTIDCYLRAVAEFSLHFHRPPNQLGPEHIRPAAERRSTESVGQLVVRRGRSPDRPDRNGSKQQPQGRMRVQEGSSFAAQS
jgi:hypothetical protein